MFACQSVLGGDSIVQAYNNKSNHAAIVNSGDSKAISIRVSQSGDHGLWAIKESGGGAYSINENEIDDALIKIGKNGLCVDPASAVSLAGAFKDFQNQKLNKSDNIVCILTASGLRWSHSMTHLNQLAGDVTKFNPSIDNLDFLLKQFF